MANAQRIALITDSTSDLPKQLLEKYDILTVPQILIWGEKEFKDRVDISPKDFYRRVEKSDYMPTTSQPPVQEYVRAYRKAMEGGAEEIVVLTNSKLLSGSFNSATEAAAQLDTVVQIIDGYGPSMSLGWQVLAAARARQDGASAQEMIAASEQVRARLIQMFTWENLDILYKSGRMRSRAYRFSKFFKLNPLLSIDHQQGVPKPIKQVRTRKRALNQLYKLFFKELNKKGKGAKHISVFHGEAPLEAEAIAERIRREVEPKELIVGITGPAIGSHTGQGVICLAGYVES